MNQLGQFEQNLLTELREAVAEQAGGPQPRRPLPHKRLALAAAGGGLLAAGLLVGLPAMNGDQAPAAYAVAANDDGTVTVTITRLDDAEGLERQLEAHGIAAEIDYTSPPKMCRNTPPRYEQTPTLSPMALEWVRARGDNPMGIKLRPADLEGKTLVMEINAEGHDSNGRRFFDSGFVKIGVTDGPVAPCALVDSE
jgi:hypothetical protein